MAAEIPHQYRIVSPYIKIAIDFKGHDEVLYYWVMNYAVEKALTLGRAADPTSNQYLMGLLDELEKIKKAHPNDDSYRDGAVAQCHVEAKALRLFSTADEKDRQGIYDKNVIKSFYTSGLLFDVLTMFTKEELEEKLQEARKYAKWRATDLNQCLKNGVTPTPPGSMKKDDDDELTKGLLDLNVDKPQPTPRTTSNLPSTPTNQFNTPPTNYPPPQNTFNDPNLGWPQQHPQAPTGYDQPFSGANYQPGAFPQPTFAPQPPTMNVAQAARQDLTVNEFLEARRLTKMASSALDYEDAKTAIGFLRKALEVLEK